MSIDLASVIMRTAIIAFCLFKIANEPEERGAWVMAAMGWLVALLWAISNMAESGLLK